MNGVRDGMILFSTLLLLSGCGEHSAGRLSRFAEKLESVESTVQPSSIAVAMDDDVFDADSGWPAERGPDAAATEADDGTAPADAVKPHRRSIIYTTQVSMVVEDFDVARKTLPQLAQRYGGFISNSRADQSLRDRRTGSWTVRVPADQYRQLLLGVTGMGHTESLTESASDVTAEYVDVQARIANNQELERRILDMLQTQTGKLEDVLKIERELARVREEVERMEGRLRVLKDQISLATVTIQVREEAAYVPPSTPSFADRAVSTFANSVSGLTRFVQGSALALIAMLPWLMVLVGVGTPTYWGLRRWWAAVPETKTPTA